MLRHGSADKFTMLIAERRSGAHQVCACRAASKIRGMARRAIFFIQLFAAVEHVLRRELSRELWESAPPLRASALTLSVSATTTAASALGRRKCHTRKCDHQHYGPKCRSFSIPVLHSSDAPWVSPLL